MSTRFKAAVVSSVLATVTPTGTAGALLPDVSRATADTECAPFPTDPLAPVPVSGATVTGVPTGAPSTRNCTLATAVSPDADAASVTEPWPAAPSVGAVTTTA